MYLTLEKNEIQEIVVQFLSKSLKLPEKVFSRSTLAFDPEDNSFHCYVDVSLPSEKGKDA